MSVLSKGQHKKVQRKDWWGWESILGGMGGRGGAGANIVLPLFFVLFFIDVTT